MKEIILGFVFGAVIAHFSGSNSTILTVIFAVVLAAFFFKKENK